MGKNSSDDLATLASEVLNSDKYSEETKSLAGSVLSQVKNGKVSSGDLATLASEVLRNKNSSEIAKKLAGSVLSQSEKDSEEKKK